MKVKGSLDLSSMKLFQSQLDEHVSSSVQYLALDLSELLHVNSHCIRLLLVVRKKLEIRGGGLLSVDAPARIRKLLHIVNLIPASHFFDSAAEAEAYLEKSRESSSSNVARSLGHAGESGRSSR